MTTRTYLPNDVSRCTGQYEDNLLHKKCEHCARHHFRNTGGLWTAHFTSPMQNGECAYFIDMEVSDD